MHVQRLIGGNRPGSRRPDHRITGPLRKLVQPKSLSQFFAILVQDRKADIDRDIGSILVLDLRLGERRAAVEAPVNGFQAAVDVTLSQQNTQSPNLVGFVPVGHGEIRILPVAQHAKALEILLLPLDLLGGVGAAQPLRLLRGKVLAVRLFDLHLDRHAVAIPAGHVRRVEPRQGLDLDDDVLEDLVHRVADVDVAVGVGRAVVQDEAGRAAARVRMRS